MFGGVAMIAFVLLLVETVSFWHARNVFDEAAAEGARVAAAFDGTCAAGTSTGRGAASHDAPVVGRRASRCRAARPTESSPSRSPATTPGVLFDAGGFTASVTQSAPKER